MRQFFKMFFASMLAMVVTGVVILAIIFGLIIGAAKSVTETPVMVMGKNSVLVLDLGNVVHEQGQTNSFASFSDDDPYTPGLYDIVHALEIAKTDANVKGILLKVSDVPNGWATMQQLRKALISFKNSGKFIYAYGEMISQKAYYLASAADKVFLNPVGHIELKGLASQMPFFKGTLDKLEVQPEIFYAGKFKSATEPFRADKMSEPNRLQIATLQNGIWSVFLQAVSRHIGKDTAAIHQLAATGAVQFPEDALRYKLIDGLLYWDEVEDKMRTKTGTGQDQALSYIKMEEYAYTTRNKHKISDKKIAVLFAEGDISDGETEDNYAIASANMTEQLRRLRKNDRIKAVVIRVNSPGGSALASEVILREVQLLRKEKPVIISMGDVAASGGYYISCQADSIFALPNTITGSIGVFTMLFNAENLLKNKLGVTFDEVKNAPYADFPTTTRALTADESNRMQASVDTIYAKFKQRVATGRNMTVAMVDSIGQGRVWTGADALKIGLIDGLGDLDRAIQSAAHKAGIRDYSIVTYPEPDDKFALLMRRFKGNTAAGMMKAAVQKELETEFDLLKQIKSLKNMNGRVMMYMPFSFNAR